MLTGVQPSQAGSYFVAVSNSAGGVTSWWVELSVSCGMTIFPENETYSYLAATGSIVITGATNCLWNLVNTNSWITFLSGVTNFGNGQLVFAVAENATTNVRYGRVLIADQAFYVTQNGRTTNAPVSLAEALDTVGVLPWDTTGSPKWFGQTSFSHDGMDSAQSGPVGHGYAVTVQTTVQGPGAISYWWKVSSETNKDYLKFFISGVQQLRISGETGWELRSLPIPSGARILKWTYSKNGSGSAGLDAGWLDEVRFFPGATGCVTALSHTMATHSWNSETGLVSVTSAAGCAWGVTSTHGWITPAVDFAGGFVRYTLSANPSRASRTGIITIAGQAFTIVQQGDPVVCTYSIAPTSRSHGYNAASGAVLVTSTSDCPWSVVVTNSWIKILTATGSGHGEVTYSVLENTSSVPRSGNVEIAGHIFTIDQAALVPCTYTLIPAGRLYSHLPAMDEFTIEAPEGCGWNFFNSNAWVTIHSNLNNSGNGRIVYSTSENTNQSPRRGNIRVGDRFYSISQAAAPLPLADAIDIVGAPIRLWHNGYPNWVGQTNVTHDGLDAAVGSGGSFTLVVTGAGTISFWGKVSSQTNSNLRLFVNGAEQFRITGEVDWEQRTMNLPAGIQNLEWYFERKADGSTEQAWVDEVQFTLVPTCPVTLSPASASHSFNSSTGLINVAAASNCVWSVFNTNAWINIAAASNGTGNGFVRYILTANPAPAARGGFLRIGGQPFFLTQAGVSSPGTNFARLRFMGRTGTNATLFVQGDAGKTYVVECSEDLIDWIPISTNPAPSTVIDAAAGGRPWRFYRTRETH
jgi:hypothetical protein